MSELWIPASEAFELTLGRLEFPEVPTLDLTLEVTDRSQRLALSSPNVQLLLEPPFVGEQHSANGRINCRGSHRLRCIYSDNVPR